MPVRWRNGDVGFARRTELLPPFEPRVDLVLVEHMPAGEDADNLARLKVGEADCALEMGREERGGSRGEWTKEGTGEAAY